MANDDEFASFDEGAWKAQDAADEREIARLLDQSQEGPNGGLKLDDDTPFDQTNKADDAEDFEDISDDDLPDEEPAGAASFEIPGLTDDGGTSNDADDLFGEGPSSPTDPILGPPSPAPRVRDADAGDDSQPIDVGMSFAGINFDPEPHLNGADNQDPDIPAAAETVEDLLKAAWPAFKKGHVLTWSELLPAKKAIWREKKPSRKPKQLVTSKLSLDLGPDSEKQFRIPGPAVGQAKPREAESRGLVHCIGEGAEEKEDRAQFEVDQDSDSETIGGFTLRDIELACEDWGTQIDDVEAEFQSRRAAEQAQQLQKRKNEVVEQDDEWDAEFLMDTADDSQQRSKTRKTVKFGLPEIPRYEAPSFDNFEEATRRGAKRVHLDMSDPHLLLETQDYQRNTKRARLDTKAKGPGTSGRGRDVSSRFNLSNDEAYELLKENHQSKVRATLGNISVEHSMPAIKLSWPYYKVKLSGTTDEYHRPRFRYKKFAGHVIKFDKPLHMKRKEMKGKAHEVFKDSQHLSLNDNSAAVLFEYCEPRPRVLNNFGMGNKLINYYRRKDNNDGEQLPKRDLGEYRTLLPEDRSPFALFGTVDAGETVPTLHNEMYRAPVFKHTPRITDFLVVRSTTGVIGSKWYLHKIDHLHVVGQTFPSVDVPGPHSRKVTNASKNRMKMLAFRMIRHSETDNCQLSDITKHIAESTDTQNRQKLKEFLQYDRDSGEKGMWRLKPGEVLPDENTIRTMIKPEEVSLLDAMQLGIKELEDAGYDPRNANIEEDTQMPDADGDEEDADEEASRAPKGTKKPAEKQEETLADKMAPWKTTKAFIDACAQKAMLQLHGEGDPTGHGLGFSFIRTSMKGGYIEAVQGPLATSADAMEREKRANGGHAYNVKKQQAMYEEGIREIWEKQKATLSDAQGHDDKDVAVTEEDEDDRFNVQSVATPAQFDDGTSQISGLTSSSRHLKRQIRITRNVQMADGTTQSRIEIVHDPVVISQYMKRRTEADLELREYVKAHNRFLTLSRRPPRLWRKLPPSVRALHRWALLAEEACKPTARPQLPAPGSRRDFIGIELRAPAYVYLSTASIAPGLRAMPTTTVLQALESKRSSSDWRKTGLDGKPESTKKRCTCTNQLQATPHPPRPAQSTRLPPGRPASVLIAGRLDISRQTKSMEAPVSPPPRPSFDWWCLGAKERGRKKRQKSGLLQKLHQSDAKARETASKKAKAEAKAQAKAEQAAAKQENQKAKAEKKRKRNSDLLAKQKARLEKEAAERREDEERDAIQRLKEDLQARRREEKHRAAEEGQRRRALFNYGRGR